MRSGALQKVTFHLNPAAARHTRQLSRLSTPGDATDSLLMDGLAQISGLIEVSMGFVDQQKRDPDGGDLDFFFVRLEVLFSHGEGASSR